MASLPESMKDDAFIVSELYEFRFGSLIGLYNSCWFLEQFKENPDKELAERWNNRGTEIFRLKSENSKYGEWRRMYDFVEGFAEERKEIQAIYDRDYKHIQIPKELF